MVGQKKLVEKINILTLDSLPKTIMLVGKYGSGKHTLMKSISNKFKLDLVDISDKLNLDTLDSIYTDIEPHIYYINGDLITEQEEAVVLKFLEEPPLSAYIIVLCENKHNMLNTIINRCQIWELEMYSKEELRQFTTNEQLLEIATTPGEILNWESEPIEAITELCYKIIDKIADSNFANVLTLSNKVKFNKDTQGYDARLFGKILSRCTLNRIISTNNPMYNSMYLKINKYINSYFGVCRDKKKLFEHLLSELKEEMFNDYQRT